MDQPCPVTVRHNDWTQVPLPDPAAFLPAQPVSVIVPCFGAQEALARTMAGLERQVWPRELLEVVVVDDGSDPPLALPDTGRLDVTVVRQERHGFGLARARNRGARAARHPILIFLDGDVIPEAGLVAAHARWHHVVSDGLTAGFCAYISVDGVSPEMIRAHPGPLADLVAGRPFDPPWLERHMARTGAMTSRHADLFRAVTGHNLGISRLLFEETGGFDETFTRYGGEDTEFAYRAQVRGALLAPVPHAFAWHQGRWSHGREPKERDKTLQAAKLAHLIPESGFRPAASGRPFMVPRHVVTLTTAAEPVPLVAQAAEALLAGPDADLVIRIRMAPQRDADRAWLCKRFRQYPRVLVADPATEALDHFPASPLHITVPVGAALPGLIPRWAPRLGAALGDAAAAVAILNDGTEVWITRAWALHRVRRAGGQVSDYGEVRRLAGRVIQSKPGCLQAEVRGSGPRTPLPWPGVQAVAMRIRAEARHIRGPRTLWRFLRWLAGALRWRIREGGQWTSTPTPAVAAGHADPPLGLEVASLGPRSRRTLAASSHVRHGPGRRQVHVVLADTASVASGVRAPLACLTHMPLLAVPAFDPAWDNPIGWVRDVEHRVASLGDVRRLPRGARARQVMGLHEGSALLHCHHIEDVAPFHGDGVQRASRLARLAARGVPVRMMDHDGALANLLGAELYGLMREGAGALDFAPRWDHAVREILSIAQRRAAHRSHSLQARVHQICRVAGINPSPWPRQISVLMATHRPKLLAAAVASVGCQRYPELQLVLALHGPGFSSDGINTALAGFTHPVTVLRVPAQQSLGAVLNAAADAADGALVAKMDDDDVYGPEHLWDLALAHAWSGATLVGKFPATVYLAHRHCTVQQRAVASETWSRSITGGTLLLSREDLARAGGWPPVNRKVDEVLVDNILGIGGTVYRTHDEGYVLVRHGRNHTWQRDDGAFLAGARAVHAGWTPRLAGIKDGPPPPAATIG